MCQKLNDLLTAPKTYWEILNRLVSNKKAAAIPPLPFDGEIIPNFSQKPAIFKKFFGSQCTPLQDLTILPTLQLRTDYTLPSLNISEDDTFTIIENLNSNKSHGWDDLVIKIIKFCSESIAYPLKLIFEASLVGGNSLNVGKST